ncbi:MAG: hypothetical protein LBG58_12740 [Planctomycetaceae bacterium]|jgi:mannose/cellobiose epimerase-like protein (N-acyl-D-glucosamine 2-epimerase family)|nr:hypothetical protein [Planctomycetaceae bacterium]
MNQLLKHVRCNVLLIVLCLFLTSQSIAQSTPSLPSKILSQTQIESALLELPKGERWIQHLKEDLMPFWEMETALGGSERGNFPSYRDNKGQLIDWSKPMDQQPQEIQGGVYLKLIFPERECLRTRSRQILGYSIAYLLTGEEKYLDYAYAGIDYNFLQKGRYYNEEDGSLAGYYDTKTKKYVAGTSQDWAYGLCGPALYYYVTKDERVLPLLLKSQKKVFDVFFDPSFGMFRWVTEPTEDGLPDQREIVSNLDQVYGYMLMVYRSLPPAEQEIWKKQIHDLALILLKEFYGSREGFFWGQAGKTTNKFYGAEHTDFGHSTKTFWLIMQIGRLTGDIALEHIGREGASKLVDIAYDPNNETWNQKLQPTDDESQLTLVHDREWWCLAIMDQTTATLSLHNPDYLRYISKTHKFWFNRMVDKEYGEMWHLLKSGKKEPDMGFPKEHSWKTCFHSTEHALVMYLLSQQLHGEKATLNFVRSKNDYKNYRQYYPYIFEAEVKPDDVTVEKEILLPKSNDKRVKVKVSFGHIR